MKAGQGAEQRQQPAAVNETTVTMRGRVHEAGIPGFNF